MQPLQASSIPLTDNMNTETFCAPHVWDAVRVQHGTPLRLQHGIYLSHSAVIGLAAAQPSKTACSAKHAPAWRSARPARAWARRRPAAGPAHHSPFWRALHVTLSMHIFRRSCPADVACNQPAQGTPSHHPCVCFFCGLHYTLLRYMFKRSCPTDVACNQPAQGTHPMYVFFCGRITHNSGTYSVMSYRCGMQSTCTRHTSHVCAFLWACIKQCTVHIQAFMSYRCGMQSTYTRHTSHVCVSCCCLQAGKHGKDALICLGLATHDRRQFVLPTALHHKRSRWHAPAGHR